MTNSVTLYSQIPFFNSVVNPIKTATDKEAFFDNINNVSESLVVEVSGEGTINLEVYGCTKIYDKDSKIIKDTDRPWSKIVLFNMKNFKKAEGVITEPGIYAIPIAGCLSVKLKITSATSTNGFSIVGAVK